MTLPTLSFSAILWRYPGAAGWHFVTLPLNIGAEVRDRTAGARRGFGSVPVVVTLGGTTWRTSIFPDRESGSFLLPVKKSVREAEGVTDGDEVRTSLELLLV